MGTDAGDHDEESGQGDGEAFHDDVVGDGGRSLGDCITLGAKDWESTESVLGKWIGG